MARLEIQFCLPDLSEMPNRVFHLFTQFTDHAAAAAAGHASFTFLGASSYSVLTKRWKTW